MQITDIATACRRGALPERLKGILAPLLPWLGAREIGTFKLAAQNHRNSGVRHPATIQMVACARDFHALAGTDTPAVEAAIERLEQGSAVRMSHQPNFAAYCKLFCLFPALARLADLCGAAPVYVVNDYDSVTDERFRHAKLPDITHPAGFRYIGVPTKKLSNRRVAFTVPKPDPEWLQDLVSTIAENYELEWRRSRRTSYDKALLAAVIDDLEVAHAKATTLTELAAIFLSRLLSLRLNIPIVFVAGHEIWRRHGYGESLDLLEKWAHIREGRSAVQQELLACGFAVEITDTEAVPYWWLCACGRRVALLSRAGNEAIADGKCDACSVATSVDFANLEGAAKYVDHILPRVGMQDLIVGTRYGFRSGITYNSSVAHSIPWGLAGELAGEPMMPQMFLTPRLALPFPIMSHDRSRERQGLPGLNDAVEIVKDASCSSVYALTRLPANILREACWKWIERDCDEPITA